jgi:hypothetical protein
MLQILALLMSPCLARKCIGPELSDRPGEDHPVKQRRRIARYRCRRSSRTA